MPEVVPFAGTWIEILVQQKLRSWLTDRSLRGNMD